MCYPFICIAGKNNIAVAVLNYIINNYKGYNIGIVCNKTETGKNHFNRSLRLFAEQKSIKEYRLEEVYGIDNLVFISLEFDQIIKPSLFLNARLYNIHFSLLPQYKGMYTSVHPILNGEEYVGVTLHKIDSGIDTGDIIDQERFAVGDSNCKELYLKFIQYGIKVVIRNLNNIIHNTVTSVPQSSYKSSYYSKASIDYRNIRIDLNQTAEGVARQIRAFSFRDYQLPKVYNKAIIDFKILDSKSNAEPGTILYENNLGIVMSTINNNIALYFDKFMELMNACALGQMDRITEICTIQKHINEQDTNGWSPLIKATYYNQVEVVLYLISVGANIHVKNRNGTNLLMYAKEAYKNYNDNTLFKLLKKFSLSEKEKDYYDHDLLFYLDKDGISLDMLMQ